MRPHLRSTFTTAALAGLLLASALSMGCGASRTSALADEGAEQATVQGDFEQTLQEADAAWAQRVDRAQLEAAIELYKKAALTEAPSMAPEAYQDRLAYTFERLSRSYYFLADSHIRLSVDDQDEVTDDMMATFEKGVTAAERAIKLRDPAFAKKIADGATWPDAISTADVSAVPGLYWYATNLGKWALLEGIATLLARKDDSKAIMEFICDNRQDYFYGACHRYFGVYWMKVPFGKDNNASKKHFDTSIEMAPNYLATKVLKAEYLATFNQDRAMFDQLLDEVLTIPAGDLAAVAPENEFEKEKARRLKARADDLFR